MKQMNLFSEKPVLEFGGSLNRGKRKTARPLDTKRPHHFVLKATNPFLLLRNRRQVEELCEKMSRRFGIKIYKLAAHADHIHLCLQIPNRVLYRRWIRGLTSMLVRNIQGLKFAFLPYSKIVTWGCQFKSVCEYIVLNLREAQLIIDSHARVDDWLRRTLYGTVPQWRPGP